MGRSKDHRQVRVKASVEHVSGEGYSYDTDTIAETETLVRLEGRFDREKVGELVTSIVNQLMAAFDEGEGPQGVTPDVTRIPHNNVLAEDTAEPDVR